MNRRSRLVIALVFFSQILAAQSLTVSLEIAGIERSGPPRLLGGQMLFTYEFADDRPGRIHTVAVAFAHDEFQTIHQFSRNDQGIYVLLVDLPANVSEARYRLIVDGIWTTDPHAPGEIRDRWGVRLSTTPVPSRERRPIDTPIVVADGIVEFTLTAAAGSRVAIVGSFNGWDPFLTPMHEERPGRFVRRVRLPPGEHLYYFSVDGQRVPDPTNRDRRHHLAGATVSVVELP